MRFGSVCSGIEAASVAWHPLGWRAAWLAEIEAFPSAVLAHHYPDVPNLGDLTTIAARVRAGGVEAPDVFVGGTPCQAFSVAGLRRGLSDARGALSIAYVDLANAIDAARSVRGEQPCVSVWENVPGVLSSRDNAFGCFLGALAGEECALEPPGGRWADAGLVFGPQRAIAWRVLDAQYQLLAQRRRRVFVVTSAREGFDPAAVLFEFEGLRRDSPPSRGAGEDAAGAIARCSFSGGAGGRPEGAAAGHFVADVAPTLSARTQGGGGLGTDFDLDGGVLAFGGNNTSGPIDVTPSLLAQPGSGWKGDFDSETFVAQCVTGDVKHTLKAEGFDASEDGTGRGQPIVPACVYRCCACGEDFADQYATGAGDAEPIPAECPRCGEENRVVAFDVKGGLAPHGSAQVSDTEFPLKATDHKDQQLVAFYPTNRQPEFGVYEDVSPAIKVGSGGTSGNPLAIAFSCKDYGQDVSVDVAPTLRGMGHAESHANGGGQLAIAFAVRGREEGAVPEVNGDGQTIGTLRAANGGSSRDFVAYPINPNALRGDSHAKTPSADAEGNVRLRDPGLGVGGADDPADTLQAAGPGAVAAFTVSAQANGFAWESDVHPTLNATPCSETSNLQYGVRVASAVRRLMPVECERLQGFPDGYTAIPWRGRLADECPDGPRYKALGNSMAVPCMAWIGQRIAAHLERSAAALPDPPTPPSAPDRYDAHVRAYEDDESEWEGRVERGDFD